MTRTGKIARLPYSVRDLLNEKLRNGESGVKLVAWLNGLPAVQDVFRAEFAGQPINEQNMSQWKKGGYVEWLQQQEERRWVSELSRRSAALEEEAGDYPITDWLATSLAVAMGRCLQQTAREAGQGPEQLRGLLELSREICRLRRGDHGEQWLKIARERWRTEQEARHEEELGEMRWKMEIANVRTKVFADHLREEYGQGMADGSISPEQAREIRELFARMGVHLKKLGVPELPTDTTVVAANPTESR